jgi:phosphatidylserine/phosphatidylglycerophosphate/cardiolipin synthase-like enzyme
MNRNNSSARVLRARSLADSCSFDGCALKWESNRVRKLRRFILRARLSFARLRDHCWDRILFRETTSPLWLTGIRFSRLCSAQFDRPNIQSILKRTSFQETFVTSWLKMRGEVLHGTDYFPPLASTGPYLAQAIRSSARNENLDLLYLLAIASAKTTLRIENAYFLPDDLMRKELRCES